MASTKDHTKLVNDFLVAVSLKNYLGFFWKNSTGAMEREDGSWIRYGLPGSSDVLGVLSNGIMCCIEMKTGKAVLRKQQVFFKQKIETNRGVYIECRDIKETLSQLERLNAIPS